MQSTVRGAAELEACHHNGAMGISALCQSQRLLITLPLACIHAPGLIQVVGCAPGRVGVVGSAALGLVQAAFDLVHLSGGGAGWAFWSQRTLPCWKNSQI